MERGEGRSGGGGSFSGFERNKLEERWVPAEDDGGDRSGVVLVLVLVLDVVMTEMRAGDQGKPML